MASRFATIFIDHVPTLDYSRRNEAKRFIILIDVLYDNGNACSSLPPTRRTIFTVCRLA